MILPMPSAFACIFDGVLHRLRSYLSSPKQPAAAHCAQVSVSCSWWLQGWVLWWVGFSPAETLNAHAYKPPPSIPNIHTSNQTKVDQTKVVMLGPRFSLRFPSSISQTRPCVCLLYLMLVYIMTLSLQDVIQAYPHKKQSNNHQRSRFQRDYCSVRLSILPPSLPFQIYVLDHAPYPRCLLVWLTKTASQTGSTVHLDFGRHWATPFTSALPSCLCMHKEAVQTHQMNKWWARQSRELSSRRTTRLNAQHIYQESRQIHDDWVLMRLLPIAFDADTNTTPLPVLEKVL